LVQGESAAPAPRSGGVRDGPAVAGVHGLSYDRSVIRTGHDHEPLAQVLWAACAGLVLVFIFLAALGAFEPGDVLPLTIAAVALAALWLAHEWRGLWRDEQRNRR
jgi:fatty acid desaturase